MSTCWNSGACYRIKYKFSVRIYKIDPTGDGYVARKKISASVLFYDNSKSWAEENSVYLNTFKVTTISNNSGAQGNNNSGGQGNNNVLPLLLRYLKLSIKQAIGTSIFVTTILSGSSAIAYMRDGYTDVVLAFTLCIGSLITIPLAKYLMLCLSDRILHYVTLLFILSSAIMMSIKLWCYF